MKITRQYATAEKAIDPKNLIRQYIELQFQEMVNTVSGSSPTCHHETTTGGDIV